MNVTHQKRANEILDQALHLSGQQQQCYLDEACADCDSLRQEVDALLEHLADDSGSFLRPPECNIKAQFDEQWNADPLINTSIGPYTIKRRIGEGGMGVVYLATRSTQYRQRVAIKVLKRGMDTEEVLRRFRTEIRVLATVSKHPHIAGLLDAGTTRQGLPYFVMQYVEGERIDDYCDKHRLTLEERLQLFLKICSAVEFAHSHGVIHRDLKPANILVGSDGGPQLIDFGIAKLTSPELSAETAVATLTNGHPMTPRYASPEQFRGDTLTTRSDVYSLGVLLYELLTGSLPYTLSDRSRDKWGWAVCEKDPSRPSSTFARRKLEQEPATRKACLRCGISSRQVRRKLRGDLDNIVLMALRKETQRRYASVEDFYRDIEHYLNRRPVSARPIHGIERAWRWCRGNAVASSLFVMLSVGSLLGTWHLWWLSAQLVRSTAMASAAQKVELIKSVHEHYSHVVQELSIREPEAAKKAKAPATFTIELGEYLEEKESGLHVRLYSDAPFRTRRNGGPRDEFERSALASAAKNPHDPIHRFEDYGGRPSLRYAIPRVMQQSCVDCHNTHPDRPRGKVWRVGDVGGVLEVIQPLDATSAVTQRHLRRTLQLVVATSLVFLIACVVIALRKAAASK